ncbi:MAG: isoprenyl transferase [Erysipelotrichaceae bacterium]
MSKPIHVAIIMDGNGRWAQAQNKPRTFGHLKGSENIREITKIANKLNVSCLTMYAFSTENWSRSANEVNYLMKLPKLFFDKYIKELMIENVKVTTIGDLSKLPKNTLAIINSAIEETANNTGLILCFAMNYGSQDEIIRATNSVVKEARANLKLPITKVLFEKHLDTSNLPIVDLLIRTSGEIRLSNFLLYQLAYAEMMFLDVCWPDFTPELFKQCLEEFEMRKRRFGGIKQ